LALGSLLVSGCATTQPTPPRLDGLPGTIAAQPGRPGLVIAAPHGTSDARTGEIVTELGRRTGFGVVVATGFNLDTSESPGRRYQVNRPFEGRPGRPPSEDVESEAARRIYDAYEQRVRETARGPLTFYVEIHGNNHRDVADRIEIATVGVDLDEAMRLRTLLELRLRIFVEPASTLGYAASGAKRDGILKLPKRALHVELPRAARTEWRELYVAILADFLLQAVPLPAER
jgi:hypothetical protein